MGKKKEKFLTHEEIWDDSALVRSWDEAVQEYKLYHSIHAKGEDVEDVLRRAQEGEGEDEEEEEVKATIQGAVPTQGELDDAMETEVDTREIPSQKNLPHQTPDPKISQKTKDDATFPRSEGPDSVPAHLFASVPDEGLKNLMMAWYYAGYYTGLYEGQRRVEKESQA